MVDSQYLLLTACPSLALISLQDSAGSSGIEPSGTAEENQLLRRDYHSARQERRIKTNLS